MRSELGDNLIFLISQPRSGSTLLQRILWSHPEVHSTSEPWLMLHPIYALRQSGYSAEYDAGQARIALEDFCGGLKEGEEAYIEGIRKMASHLYGRALTSGGKRFFLDKTPRYYLVIPELRRIFPNAHFVILFRNPLAVLHSILETWVQDDVERLALHKPDLIAAPRLLADAQERLGDRGVVVQYENLAANPEETIRQLCEKLPIDFDSAMLEYGKTVPPPGRMGDPRHVQRHCRVVPDYVHSWKTMPASPQFSILAESYLTFLGGDLLLRLGYSSRELRRELANLDGAPRSRTAEKMLRVLGLPTVQTVGSEVP